jgi:hypothetical protein
LLALFSYIGGAMYDVGASWLMTSLAPKPLFVSLITKKEQISTIAEYDPFDEIFDAFDEYFNRCYFYNYMISTTK